MTEIDYFYNWDVEDIDHGYWIWPESDNGSRSKGS